MQYRTVEDKDRRVGQRKGNGVGLKVEGRGGITRQRVHINTFSFTGSPCRQGQAERAEENGPVTTPAHSHSRQSSRDSSENSGPLKQRCWNSREKSVSSRSSDKNCVFKEINLNNCNSATDFQGQIAKQFGNLFSCQEKSQFDKEIRISKSTRFHKYNNNEELRCRFKAKLLRVPNISKYMSLTEITNLFDKCMEIEMPEAQWQLNVVELIRKRLNR